MKRSSKSPKKNTLRDSSWVRVWVWVWRWARHDSRVPSVSAPTSGPSSHCVVQSAGYPIDLVLHGDSPVEEIVQFEVHIDVLASVPDVKFKWIAHDDA